ncbi:hypothetical protein RF397_11940, partial [Acinetobacter baumannii]|nr:hypothetical protein [Acinetobacter baumannii]
DDIAVVKAYLKHETTLYTEGEVDKQYNNELIGALEEYQKLYDLSVQDDTLNNETLLEMGFGTDSNNKMVKNSYYIEYL